MKMMSLFALTVVLCSPFAATAGEADVGVIPPKVSPPVTEKPKLPEKEILAVSEKWKIQNLTERLQQTGATGQQEVFFEILELCDSKPEARGDTNLEAVLNYLLFDAGLWTHANVREPAFIRVPPLLPKVGAKMIDTRLNSWLTSVSLTPNGSEPWLWPEYKRIDAKSMSEAVKRLAETPRHNPIARFWVSGLMLAVDFPEAEKQYIEALKKVEDNYASQSKLAAAQLLESLAGNGVRGALPLMLVQAESEGAQPLAFRSGRGAYYDERIGNTLARLFQLLSLPPMQLKPNTNMPDTAAEIAKLKPWLKANLESLTWEATKRVYSCDAAPPGLETFFKAAKALEKSYDFKCLEKMSRSPYEQVNVVRDLIALMEKNAAAAKDPMSEEMLLALLDRQPQIAYDDRTTLLFQLPKINRKLGVTVWARAIKQMLSNPTQGNDLLTQQNEIEPAIVQEACASLLPEFQKTYDTARAANDVEGALSAAMSLLYLGGKPDRVQVADLLGKAPTSWTSGRYDSKLGRWSNNMLSTRRTGYLRLLLISATRELDTYGQKNRNTPHPLGQFQYSCGWADSTNGMPGNAAEILAQCEEWLNQNESLLKYDSNRSRFTGALSPQKQALAKLIEPLAKYGVKTGEDAFAYGNERDNARVLLESVLQAAETKPEAAKDPATSRAIAGLVEPAKGMEYDTIARRLLVNLPRIDRAAGVKVWSDRIRKDLENSIRNWYVGSEMHHESRYQDADPAVIKDARAALLPEYKKLADAATGTAGEKCNHALICLYLGEPANNEKLEKLFTENEQQQARRAPVTQWGSILAQSGNIAGLRVLLLQAKVNPKNTSSLSTFEQYSGIYNLEVRPELPRMPNQKLEVYLNWFNTFEKKFVFNPDQRGFIAPPFTVDTVKPPAPPADGKNVDF